MTLNLPLSGKVNKVEENSISFFNHPIPKESQSVRDAKYLSRTHKPKKSLHKGPFGAFLERQSGGQRCHIN